MPSVAHRAYLAAIAIKGLDGAIETVAGVVVAFIGSQQLYNFAVWCTAPEIARNPDSGPAHFVRHSASNLAHASATFVVIYLLAHGIIKLGIAINLLRGKLWFFPIAAVLLAAFVVFMCFRLTGHWSDWLFAFMLFDVLTIGLVLNEWRNKRATFKPVAGRA